MLLSCSFRAGSGQPCWWELAFSSSTSLCCHMSELATCPVVAVAIGSMQIGLICIQEVMGLLQPGRPLKVGDGRPLKVGVSRAVPAVVLPPRGHRTAASTLRFAFLTLGQSVVHIATAMKTRRSIHQHESTAILHDDQFWS